MSSVEPGVENRVHPRQAANRRGVVLHGPTGEGYGCVILDISAGGARLHLLDHGMPEQELTLVDSERGTMHDLRVAWRSPPFAGVAFTSTVQLP